ncbi:MAG: YbaN family protein [Candidatus Cloacimonadota bacterium]|nr:YbaN family protein [Candidatus Cloacimonadota bacterium]
MRFIKTRLKKYLLIIAGILAMSAGFLGIFLPILPTTPLLLLAAACFLKSSRNLYLWTINHKLFGLYIRNYLKYKAVSKKHKIITVFMLWLVITISIILVKESIFICLLLLGVAIGVSWHVRSLPIITADVGRR